MSYQNGDVVMLKGTVLSSGGPDGDGDYLVEVNKRGGTGYVGEERIVGLAPVEEPQGLGAVVQAGGHTFVRFTDKPETFGPWTTNGTTVSWVFIQRQGTVTVLSEGVADDEL